MPILSTKLTPKIKHLAISLSEGSMTALKTQGDCN